MGAAEVIAFEEVRARKQWDTLRHQLHERFDQWLDTLETQWHEPPATLPEMTATVWNLRQQLTGGITEAIVAHVHRGEHDRTQVNCPRCDRGVIALFPRRRTVSLREVGCLREAPLRGMVEVSNNHHSSDQEPLYGAYYTDKGLVDNHLAQK